MKTLIVICEKGNMNHFRLYLWLIITLSFLVSPKAYSQKKEYSNYLFKYYLEKGIELNIGSPVSANEILNLAKSNPKSLTVYSNGYRTSEIVEIAKAGVKIILQKNKNNNKQLNHFDYIKIIENCSNGITLEYHGGNQSLNDLAKNNIHIRIVKKVSQYQVEKLIRRHPHNFTVVSKHNPNGLKKYLTLGAKIEVNHLMNPSQVEQLIRKGKKMVTINCDKYSYSELRKFVELGAKIVISKPLSQKEITKLVQSNPYNVTVNTTYYSKQEIERIVKYGLRNLKYTTCNNM